ncbi:MAG: M20 family metallopeptidase [Candidatus Omnitrophica bacterium]|nr:M20 family metallopeptidase [Candidatus Omnitrophota bacterium]
MINKNRLIKLTQKLISIDSQNPPGDEYAIARFVKRYLDNLGINAKIYTFKKRRSNVVARLKVEPHRPSLLITPHLDTVPKGNGWRFDPFLGKIYRHRIYGLGATDCKGNLAVALEVINSLIEDGVTLDYNLIFAATADEESGSFFGLKPLLERQIIKPNLAVVLDADEFKIIVAQKGLVHLKVTLFGRRAHGAYPWQGRNAITLAVDILKELKDSVFTGNKGRVYPKNKYLKPPTLNIGTIKGGDKVNIVADWCEFELDFRFLPGMSANVILKDLREIIQKYTYKFKIKIEGIQKPYQIKASHNLVKYLSQAIRNVGMVPKIKGSEGATTISFFADKHIPAVAVGFGSSGCSHRINEYVKIDNLYKGAQALEEFLKNFCF